MLSQSILEMLKKYDLNSIEDYENALKEIIQEIALLALWRAKFFEHGLFYGGSALRILYRMERFSEDLDFSLINPNLSFSLNTYKKAIEIEMQAHGFDISIEVKDKKKFSAVESAFVKANTLAHLMKINAQVKTHPDALLKIKLEVDRDPPLQFKSETKYHLSPIPFSIKTMTLPSLFAGKMHALLCRQRVINVKGRDWYDLIWFVKNETPLNLLHLKERMIQTKHIQKNEELSVKHVQELLQEKASTTDFDRAVEDIKPFLKNKSDITSLSLWSEKFFLSAILPHIKGVEFEA